MNTTTFSTTRRPFTAFALALSITAGLLLGANGLAAHGVAAAQLACVTTPSVAT
jgi:hypothetical protein